jgi:hypothetical protein
MCNESCCLYPLQTCAFNVPAPWVMSLSVHYIAAGQSAMKAVRSRRDVKGGCQTAAVSSLAGRQSQQTVPSEGRRTVTLADYLPSRSRSMPSREGAETLATEASPWGGLGASPPSTGAPSLKQIQVHILPCCLMLCLTCPTGAEQRCRLKPVSKVASAISAQFACKPLFTSGPICCQRVYRSSHSAADNIDSRSTVQSRPYDTSKGSTRMPILIQTQCLTNLTWMLTWQLSHPQEAQWTHRESLTAGRAVASGSSPQSGSPAHWRFSQIPSSRLSPGSRFPSGTSPSSYSRCRSQQKEFLFQARHKQGFSQRWRDTFSCLIRV